MKVRLDRTAETQSTRKLLLVPWLGISALAIEG